jgi:hypothetical protein
MFMMVLAASSLLALAVVIGLVWASARTNRSSAPMASDPMLWVGQPESDSYTGHQQLHTTMSGAAQPESAPASDVDSAGFDAGGADAGSSDGGGSSGD